MNAELHPFTNGQHSSESASTIDRDITPLTFVSSIAATNMCFQERSLYTQEVLAVVMQQLIEVTPLPTLFMRTVIQSLAMYPKLLGFVINILQRLITKQVGNLQRADNHLRFSP